MVIKWLVVFTLVTCCVGVPELQESLDEVIDKLAKHVADYQVSSS